MSPPRLDLDNNENHVPDPKEDFPMFDFHCAECNRRQVLFPSQVEQVINDDQGIALIVRCWCGELGALRTGAKAHTVPTERPAFELAS